MLFALESVGFLLHIGTSDTFGDMFSS
jgi:hypothetical protein